MVRGTQATQISERMIITPANMINISSTLTTLNAATQIPLTPITTTLQHNTTTLSPITRQTLMSVTILPSHNHTPNPQEGKDAEPRPTPNPDTHHPDKQAESKPQKERGKKEKLSQRPHTRRRSITPRPTTSVQQSPQHHNAGIKPPNHTGQEGNYLTQTQNQPTAKNRKKKIAKNNKQPKLKPFWLNAPNAL